MNLKNPIFKFIAVFCILLFMVPSAGAVNCSDDDACACCYSIKPSITVPFPFPEGMHHTDNGLHIPGLILHQSINTKASQGTLCNDEPADLQCCLDDSAGDPEESYGLVQSIRSKGYDQTAVFSLTILTTVINDLFIYGPISGAAPSNSSRPIPLYLKNLSILC